MAEYKFNCPLEATINIIGGKYKAIIIYHLINETLRFNQLEKLIPQATPKMLSQQLKDLQQYNIITRKVYPVVPPKTEYSLTDYGKTLVPIVHAICEWGHTYMYEYIKHKN